MVVLDAMDRRILEAAQAWPELSVAGLAEKVGLSHTPCWRRLKRLEREGVIVGRATILDQEKVGLLVTVFANIQLRQHDETTLEAFEVAARERQEIIGCFSIGGDYDYLLKVVVYRVEDYEALLKRVLLHLPGVATVKSNFVMRRVKTTWRLPVRG